MVTNDSKSGFLTIFGMLGRDLDLLCFYLKF